MACNQKQIKLFPWTVERAAALFKEARVDFTDKGITDFNQIVDGLSARHNLKREIIIKGLSSPRGVARTLTDDMWVKQQSARRVAQTAKAAVREWDHGKFLKGLNYAAEAPRRVLLAGHFAAFTKSHLADQAFYNPATYARNFKDSWHLATKHGRALHEQRLRTEFNPTDPEYKLALRAGLNVGEGGIGKFSKETGEVTGGIKKFFKGPDRASMAYDELRISRMRIFRKELQRLSPEERGDLEQVKALASVLNHDTGTTAFGNRVARFLFLSPRLLPAQLSHTFIDIPKALYQTGLGFRYKEAAPAMRYVARKSAILASAYTGIMAVNTGIGLVTGDKRFMPNLGQEGIGKGSWLRPKLFNRTIPISPTIELLKLPFQMIAAGVNARPGESKVVAAGSRGLRTLLSRQNPLAALIEERYSGKMLALDDQPHSLALPEKRSQPRRDHESDTGNTLRSKLPIPLQNYVQEFYDELASHGMPPKDALEWVKMLTAPTIEAITSYHLSPVHETPVKEKKELSVSQQIKADKAKRTRERKKAMEED